MMFPKPNRKTDKKLLESVRRMRCCVCGAFPSDASHIRTRGSGGPDTDWNVVPHCRDCHRSWGSIGWSKFCEKNPHFRSILERMGWEFGEKLWHPLLGEVDQYQESGLDDRDGD